MSAPVSYSPGHLARLLGLPEPTAEQAAVIAAPLEPVAVIAGAGSGKSETMAARLVWLAANGLVRPEQVLGLTFTRKAAGELSQRVRARLAGLRRAGLPVAASRSRPDQAAAPLDGEPVVSTYHAYAARLVSEHALREALEPAMRLVTPAVAWQIAAKVVAAYPGPMDAVNWAPPRVTAAVLGLAGELAEHLLDPADVRRFGDWLRTACETMPGSLSARQRRILDCQRTREQLLPIVSGYAEAKAAREVIDYGDQVALAARIATRHPAVGAIERARYRAVLLDEFQDTSHAQLVLLQALFGAGHPVTAVGDPCQSIYGWRGASAGNLVRFADEFPAGTPGGAGLHEAAIARLGLPEAGPPRPGLPEVGPARLGLLEAGPARPGLPEPRPARPAAIRMLGTSFRNTERVLEVAAVLQEGLREQAPLVPRLVPPPERAGRGAVVCALLDTAAQEARWVAGAIAELLSLPRSVAPDGEPWPHPSTDRVQPSDIAVLCRKRSQFAALRAAIEARGIPVEVVGLGGLLTVPEVADIVATLRVLHDPTASGPLARLLTGPRWRIGPRDLVALGRRARHLAAAQREGSQPGSQPDPEHPGAGPSASPPGASAGHRGGGAPASPPRAGTVPGPAGEPGEAEASSPKNDAIDGAVTDLTTDPGSLVEALDDLGDPGGYSPAGHARFRVLAAELRALRGHAARPLPDLVGEVERVLGLDIEIAAQPWRDPAAARADLDAFADAAAAFADDEEEPTLGAFLAYLAAAETEEFGLESGQPSGANAVTLTTVHGAKGLQWAAVVVPGLSAGPKAQVFPARPRVTTRWTDNPRLVPFRLRGDSEDLPELADLTAESLDTFAGQCLARELAEERRLAYVAVTRAAFWVACTGYWWGEPASPLGPSVFLEEVRAACQAGAGTVAHWAAPPADDAENPALAEPATASWPVDPSGSRYQAVREAAAMVEQALAAQEPGSGSRPVSGGPGLASGGPGLVSGGPKAGRGEMSEADRALAQAWERDTGLLLRELAERRGEAATAVPLPARLSVSSLVTIAADPSRLAQQIRRPMPQPPAPQARRGTAFHQWLEERFGQQRLLEPADLLGAADDPADDEDAADLGMLRERFEASEWGNRWPVEVEVPFETLLGGRTVRGRIDAVFAAPDDGYDVVDWKTGQPPGSAEEFRAAAVQLGAYRVAWSRLTGTPLSQVSGGFYYVRHDLTLRPADLLDESGLAALIEGIPLAG